MHAARAVVDAECEGEAREYLVGGDLTIIDEAVYEEEEVHVRGDDCGDGHSEGVDEWFG